MASKQPNGSPCPAGAWLCDTGGQHTDLALAETELGLAGRGPVRRAILQPASTKAPNFARGHARMPAGQASRGAGGEHGYQEDPDEQLDQACGGGAAC